MNRPVIKTDNWKRIAVASWAIVGVFAVLWISLIILNRLQIVIPLIIYTAALVYILRPAVEKLHSRGVSRGFAVFITYLVMFALLALLMWYLIPFISKQLIAFINDFPTRVSPLQEVGLNILKKYQARLGGTAFDLDKIIFSFANNAKEFSIGVIAKIPKATINLFGGILNLILALILAFYVLKDLPVIKETISDLIPRTHRDEVLLLIHKTNIIVAGFLKGQLVVAIIVGLLVSVWLLIVGIDFPFVIGMIAGALNIIPYLGPILGGILAVLVASFNPVSPFLKIIFVVAGMIGIQQLDSAVISPQVMQRHVNLHPSLIVFALLIGGSLFGVLGMLIAIPTLAVGKVLLYHFISKQDVF